MYVFKPADEMLVLTCISYLSYKLHCCLILINVGYLTLHFLNDVVDCVESTPKIDNYIIIAEVKSEPNNRIQGSGLLISSLQTSGLYNTISGTMIFVLMLYGPNQLISYVRAIFCLLVLKQYL